MLFLIIQILRPCLARRSVAWIFFLTMCASVLLIVKNGISQVNSESTDSMYKVVRVSIAPVIDGYLDDPAWKRAKLERLQWDCEKKQIWNQKDNFEGLFASVWHNDALYLAVRLQDNYFTTKQKDILKQDRLEFHFDFDKIGKKNEKSQYLVAVGSDDMKQNSTLNTLFSWNKTANKSFEFRLSLKAKPNKGDQAYFAIFYHDVDGDAVQQKVGWSRKSADQLGQLTFTKTMNINAAHTPVQWGRIKSLY